MGMIADAAQLSLNASKQLLYKGQKMGKWWEKTLYHFDKNENVLYYKNFSFAALILHTFKYKKNFDREGVVEWLKEERRSSSTASKLAISRILSGVDPEENRKITAYKNLLRKYPFGLDHWFIEFIQNEKLDPNTSLGDRETLLSEACVNGRFELVQYLVKKRVEIKGEASSDSRALHGAIAYGKREVIGLLLRNGVDPEGKNSEGETPLLAAIRRLQEKPEDRSNTFQIIKLLTDHKVNLDSKVQLKGGKPLRPLERAISFLNGNDASGVVKLLLDQGAPLPKKKGEEYLLRAIYGHKKDVVELLLEKEISFGTPTRSGDTPLIALIELFKGEREDKERLIRLLCQKGVDPNRGRSYSLQTPLHVAAQKGDADTVKLLLELGANKAALDRDGKTPLELAQVKGYQAVIQALNP